MTGYVLSTPERFWNTSWIATAPSPATREAPPISLAVMCLPGRCFNHFPTMIRALLLGSTYNRRVTIVSILRDESTTVYDPGIGVQCGRAHASLRRAPGLRPHNAGARWRPGCEPAALVRPSR